MSRSGMSAHFGRMLRAIRQEKAWIPALALVALWLLICYPEWQVRHWLGYYLPTDRAKLINDVRLTVVQALGGSAVLFGLVYTRKSVVDSQRASARNLEIAQATLDSTQRASAKNLEIAQATLDSSVDAKRAEHLDRALEQLTDKDELYSRMLAIHSLERVASESDSDQWAIVSILAAFVRECAVKPEALPIPRNPLDIQEALGALGRVHRAHETETERLDLSGIGLGVINLCGHFEWCNLWGSWFDGTNLVNCRLDHVRASNAVFNMAWISDTWFNDAHLDGVRLHVVHMNGGGFEGANLVDARLTGGFVGVSFRDTEMSGTHFTDDDGAEVAVFSDCDFSGAKNLYPDRLRKAQHIENCRFDGATYGSRSNQAELEAVQREMRNP